MKMYDIRNIKYIITTTLIILLAVCLCSCSSSDSNEIKYIEKELSLSLDNYTVTKSVDTHGGFHGDGESFYVAQDAQKRASLISQFDEKWNELPLTDELYSMTRNMGADDDITLPQVENGYYCFIDRTPSYDENGDYKYNKIYDNLHPKSHDILNYTLVLYDTDNDILYYYELDT